MFIGTSIVLTAQSGAAKQEVCYNPNLVKDTSKKSIRSMAYLAVQGDSIKINYHSPGVRKRVIWGGLGQPLTNKVQGRKPLFVL